MTDSRPPFRQLVASFPRAEHENLYAAAQVLSAMMYEYQDRRGTCDPDPRDYVASVALSAPAAEFVRTRLRETVTTGAQLRARGLSAAGEALLTGWRAPPFETEQLRFLCELELRGRHLLFAIGWGVVMELEGDGVVYANDCSFQPADARPRSPLRGQPGPQRAPAKAEPAASTRFLSIPSAPHPADSEPVAEFVRTLATHERAGFEAAVAVVRDMNRTYHDSHGGLDVDLEVYIRGGRFDVATTDFVRAHLRVQRFTGAQLFALGLPPSAQHAFEGYSATNVPFTERTLGMVCTLAQGSRRFAFCGPTAWVVELRDGAPAYRL